MQKMIKKFMITALVIFFAQLLCIVGLVFLSKVLPTFEYIEDILIISLCVVVIIDLYPLSPAIFINSASKGWVNLEFPILNTFLLKTSDVASVYWLNICKHSRYSLQSNK